VKPWMYSDQLFNCAAVNTTATETINTAHFLCVLRSKYMDYYRHSFTNRKGMGG